GATVQGTDLNPCPRKEPFAVMPTSARRLPQLLLPLAVCTLAAWTPPPVAAADEPKVTTPNASVKGDTKDVISLKATPTKLRAYVLGCMCWADDKGTAFWTLDPVGTIRRLSFPDLKETHNIELGKKCSWLNPSAEGLVVSVSEAQEVWLLDPDKFTVKQK